MIATTYMQLEEAAMRALRAAPFFSDEEIAFVAASTDATVVVIVEGRARITPKLRGREADFSLEALSEAMAFAAECLSFFGQHRADFDALAAVAAAKAAEEFAEWSAESDARLLARAS